VGDDGDQLFLPFGLRHLDLVKGGSDLSSDLVELLGGDMQMAVASFRSLPVLLERSWQSQRVRMNFRPGNWPVLCHL
jgi:hypothetical protein